MKSVVLEIKDNKAAVLDDGGVVHAIRNKGYEVGQVLSLSEFELRQDEIKPKARTGMSTFTRTAAAILAVAIIGGGVTAYAAPVSTVTVDGGTSVEYKLNLLGRVIGVSSSDDEISDEISELSREVRGMKIDDAIDATTVRLEKEFVVGDDDAEIPEIKVRVSGLKGRDSKFTESLGHKVEKMNEDNRERYLEHHMEIENEAKDMDKTESAKPSDAQQNNSSPSMPAKDERGNDAADDHGDDKSMGNGAPDSKTTDGKPDRKDAADNATSPVDGNSTPPSDQGTTINQDEPTGQDSPVMNSDSAGDEEGSSMEQPQPQAQDVQSPEQPQVQEGQSLEQPQVQDGQPSNQHPQDTASDSSNDGGRPSEPSPSDHGHDSGGHVPEGH